MKSLCLLLAIAVAASSAADFKKTSEPILEKNCYRCHSEKTGKRKGGFVFDDLETFKLDIADNDVAQIGPAIPMAATSSEVIVNASHEKHMPPDDQLSNGDIHQADRMDQGRCLLPGMKPVVASTTPSARKSLSRHHEAGRTSKVKPSALALCASKVPMWCSACLRMVRKCRIRSRN